MLRNLFPAAPPKIIAYVPNSAPEAQRDTATGKVLIQFDPFQALISAGSDPCTVYQQAMFRLWVEDRPRYEWQKYWAATPDQLITDFENHNPYRKRDEACQIPSSLPEASTAAKGVEMKFSSAGDPDSTHWFTLGVSPDKTTSSKGSSSPSNLPEAHQASASTSKGSTKPTSVKTTPPTTPKPTAFSPPTFSCTAT